MELQDDDFLLKDEVENCVELLSFSLNASSSLNLQISNRVPEKVTGDIKKFRLLFITVVEFALKYCVDGNLDMKVVLEKLTDNKKYMV